MTFKIVLAVIIILLLVVFIYLAHRDCTKKRIPAVEQFESVEPAPKKMTPSAKKLLDHVRYEFVDPDYKFNVAGLPVTTNKSSKYMFHIKNNVNEWNGNLSVVDYHILFLEETDDEFHLICNLKLMYFQRTIHLKCNYYGVFHCNDDFFGDKTKQVILQLISIDPVNKVDYGYI